MIKAILDIIAYKLHAIASPRLAFSATVFETKLDKTAVIRQNVRLYRSSLGRYSYINRHCLIQSTDIGAFCSISEGCNIGLPAHPTNLVSTSPVFLEGGNYFNCHLAEHPFISTPKTTIGNDVWIGAHAQIKSGLTIGDGAIIGAGAVVTHDVLPYAIVGGVPAKLIRFRFDEDIREKLLKSQWWNLPDNDLRQIGHSFANITDFINNFKDL